MEPLKHECGVALIRLRKPLEYYFRKYGSYTYGLDKLYLMMEKQHNRGQEAAGVGVIKMMAPAGNETIFRERALGKDAIQNIFASIYESLPTDINEWHGDEVAALAPFIGEVYMGHLRYSTTGRSGLMYAHPVLRRNNWRSRSVMLCGNFNMTNVDRMFAKIVSSGQHPRLYSDTNMLLEQIGYALDKENHRLYREYRDTLEDPTLAHTIENKIDMANVLRATAGEWDGGYVMCGATGAGNMFAMRDPHGIRPAFYYIDDEVIVLASERPVIQTCFDVSRDSVKELGPGEAMIVSNKGDVAVERILPEGDNRRCSFERIYFSRGSDADIYRERKALGAALVEDILTMIGHDYEHTVFSFIPNTAEAAFYGMVEELENRLNGDKLAEITRMATAGQLTDKHLAEILARKIRQEKVAVKDVKMRTFITEGESRNDMVAHVYDVTYGVIEPGVDTLVVIDDSIVRGTTLRESILRQLDRLNPRRIIIVSSSPQVRYPDYYGIDMANMDEFIAFRAAIELLIDLGCKNVIDDVYRQCKELIGVPDDKLYNPVKSVYDRFSDDEISNKMVEMLRPDGVDCPIEMVFQSIEGLRTACPNHTGDWYFTGDYPTPGGFRLLHKAFIDYYEKRFPIEKNNIND